MTKISISILNDMVNSINGCTSESELELLYEQVEKFIEDNQGELELSTFPIIEKLSPKIQRYAKLKKNTVHILTKFLSFIRRLRNKYDVELKITPDSILPKLTSSSEERSERNMQDLEKGKIDKSINSLLVDPPYLANFDLQAEDLTIHLNDSDARK
jgi:hypothetical protein